jgi:hypothetical protein
MCKWWMAQISDEEWTPLGNIEGQEIHNLPLTARLTGLSHIS